MTALELDKRQPDQGRGDDQKHDVFCLPDGRSIQDKPDKNHLAGQKHSREDHKGRAPACDAGNILHGANEYVFAL
jgi:hypothetical protein